MKRYVVYVVQFDTFLVGVCSSEQKAIDRAREAYAVDGFKNNVWVTKWEIDDDTRIDPDRRRRLAGAQDEHEVGMFRRNPHDAERRELAFIPYIEGDWEEGFWIPRNP